MKPVRPDRLAEAVRRVVAGRSDTGAAAGTPGPEPPSDETIPVELGGVTTFVQRSQILYAQAQGDYARLHTGKASHLVRISLNALEERWGEHGFVRIHRSTLVSTHHITAVTINGGRCRVRLVDDSELEVSRRHTRALARPADPVHDEPMSHPSPAGPRPSGSGSPPRGGTPGAEPSCTPSRRS